MSEMLSALTNPLLPRADFPVQVQATAVVGPDGRPTTALVLSLSPPPHETPNPAPSGIVVRAVDRLGREVTRVERGLDLTQGRWPQESGPYELLHNLPLSPGRYELRVGVLAGGAGASAYTHVEIPDFTRVPVSALFLSAKTTPPEPGSAASDILLPIAPTTRRRFTTGEPVRAVLRVYQTSDEARPPTVATSEIVDRSGRVILTAQTAPSALGSSRVGGTDYVLSLPLATLAPGAYLLRISVKVGDAVVSRVAVFEKA
jgi:hypothetical protein